MLKLSDVLARFRRTKREPDPAPAQKYPAEIGGGRMPDKARQEFEAWQRQWAAIQQSIDELVEHVRQESAT